MTFPNYNGDTQNRYWATSLNAELKGNNKTIKGLTIVSHQSYAGLLAYMGHNDDYGFYNGELQSGFVSDLTFLDGCIGLAPLVSGKYSPWYCAGMAAGRASEGVMSNVKATGTVTIKMLGEESVSWMYVGTLVGEASGHSELLIKECTNEATLTVTGKAEQSYVGGIVGSQGGYLFNCVNKGNVISEITSTESYVGGIAGAGYVVASANLAQFITSTADGASIGGICGSRYAYGCYSKASSLPIVPVQEGETDSSHGFYVVTSESDIDEDKVIVMNAAIIEAYKETTLKPLVWYLANGTLSWKEHTWSN